jgi:hypothetical protein
MDEGFKWGKVVGVLFLRPDPEIDFHARRIGFPSSQSPLDRIVNLMGFWITGPFHDHEMGIVIVVEHLIVLVHGGLAPATEIEPGFWVQRVAVSGITMFIDPCRDAAILKRSLRGKPIKDNPIVVGALDRSRFRSGSFSARIGEIARYSVDVPWLEKSWFLRFLLACRTALRQQRTQIGQPG